MAQPLVLLCCCAALVAAGRGAPPTATPARPGSARTTQPEGVPEEEPLQNEADNQENILSQLLGDYDKVKAVSEGSNCQCKCLVRPLGRGACQRINEGASKAEDFYTVETITSGPDCKCACVAPPSALNPCEGDFRLKKLREAESSDLKLSSIIEMLESAFYGLDLLKLHSVTTKLVGRVEKLEEEVSRNLTRKNMDATGNVDAIWSEPNTRDKENCSSSISNSLPDIRSSLQRDAAAVYTHIEVRPAAFWLHMEVPGNLQRWLPTLTRLPTQPLQRRLPTPTRLPAQPLQCRLPTPTRDACFTCLAEDESFSGDHTVDLLIEDQLLRHNSHERSSTTTPALVGGPLTLQNIAPTMDELTPALTPAAPTTIVDQLPATLKTTTSPGAITMSGSVDEPATWTPAILTQTGTQAPTTAANLPTANPRKATIAVATTTVHISTTTGTSVDASRSEESAATALPTLVSPTLPATPRQNLDEEDLRSIIGRCKDTLSTISGPTIQNTYGRNEGAWMKDPLAKDERIYVTNYYYGNTLVEFRNLENFKQGRWSNSYKLPYSWIGTGHAVYNGSLYYNRAFTRNIIKYDLKQRYVAAWAMLHDVAYEEATPWRWQGHSDVDFAVDENGLWIIYPAINYEGFSQEVIVLSKLNAADLSTQKETTWRTGLRRNFYGNCFVICGVLYAVDSYNHRNANISYAFDTHTNTQIIPRLLFENEYSYITQIDYNPKDRLLYAWDNGHQVTYHVIFAY
uniref:Olfactomedin-like domain-containing protein n=1 Tax=Terrapene triunguis TaxID=2587831 RepID=A0A674IMY1_9SAUR